MDQQRGEPLRRRGSTRDVQDAAAPEGAAPTGGRDAALVARTAEDGASLDVPPTLPPSTLLHLQRRAGNRGVAGLIAPRGRRGAPTTQRAQRGVSDELGEVAGLGQLAPALPLQRQAIAGGDVPVQRDRTPGGEKIEFKWKLANVKDRVEISGRFSANRKGSTFVEGPSAAPGDAGTAKWSLVENKASVERGAGKWGGKLASALGKWDWSGKVPGFEYLKVGFETKALEGKFDLVKKEADLDVLKFSVALSGDVAPAVLGAAGMGHLADRIEMKAQLKAEVGISPRDLARLKAAFRSKEELKAASDALEQHAKRYARAAEELDTLKTQRDGIKKRLEPRLKQRDDLIRKINDLENPEPRGGHNQKPKGAARRARQRKIKKLRAELKRVNSQIKPIEKQLKANTDKATKVLGRAKEARKGMGEAGKTLSKAGRKLDDALKGVKGKLGKAGKEALDKATKKIMKKLGKTLAKKIIAKLIPGLNVISTVMDIVEVGGALWDLATGKRKIGLPLEDELGGDGEGDEGGPGGSGTAKEGGTTTGGDDAGTGNGAGGDAGSGSGDGDGEGAQVDPAVRQVLESLAQQSLVIDPSEAEVLNQLIPRDITPDELAELQRRLKAGIGGSSDPYDLAASIQSELDDIRAGGTKTTIDGKEVPIDPDEAAEPPKTLLPATRTDVMDLLTYDATSGQMIVKPEQHKAIVGNTYTHADGLEVLVSAMDVTSAAPEPDLLFISVSIDLEVAKLPSSAGADYPWKAGQKDTEKMTFLYSPSRDLWGEMDYSIAHGLRGLLVREGGGWKLKQKGTVLAMQYARVRVDELVAHQSGPKQDGGIQHRFILRVTPIEITGEEAGYRHAGGWIKFEKGKAVEIPFAFSEQPQPAGAK